ncbi:MAG: hypothetical protein LC652_03220 [Halomonas sp.]|nr:hypothetical protein [Halomonas sp.]
MLPLVAAAWPTSREPLSRAKLGNQSSQGGIGVVQHSIGRLGVDVDGQRDQRDATGTGLIGQGRGGSVNRSGWAEQQHPGGTVQRLEAEGIRGGEKLRRFQGIHPRETDAGTRHSRHDDERAPSSRESLEFLLQVGQISLAPRQ